MGGFVYCQVLLIQVVCEVDLIFVEGVMGLFDGNFSSVDLVVVFGLLVICVIDVLVMVQIFVVLVIGLQCFWFELYYCGVVVNWVGSLGYGCMVGEGLLDDLFLIVMLLCEFWFILLECYFGFVQVLE